MVLGFEDFIKHVSQQGARVCEFRFLILERNANRLVIVEDLSPRIEKVHSAILYTTQTFLLLCLVGGLLSHAFKEAVKELMLERGALFRDLFSAPGWR